VETPPPPTLKFEKGEIVHDAPTHPSTDPRTLPPPPPGKHELEREDQVVGGGGLRMDYQWQGFHPRSKAFLRYRR